MSRRPNFLPLDESPFANEWFTPTYSQHFFRLPARVREKLVAEQTLASDGISTSLLKVICQRLYELDFLQAAHCARHLWPARDLVALEPDGAGWRVTMRDNIAERSVEVGVDCLILATGYTWTIPAIPGADPRPHRAGERVLPFPGGLLDRLGGRARAQDLRLERGAGRPRRGRSQPQPARLAQLEDRQRPARPPGLRGGRGRGAGGLGEPGAAGLPGRASLAALEPATAASQPWGGSTETFDLAVVGAGIVGTLAAAQAARRRPDWRVLLVDRGLAGGGATRHSAALCLPFGRTEGHRRMERESDRFYRELRAERPGLPIRDVPCFVVAREGSLEEVRTRCTTRVSGGAGGDRPRALPGGGRAAAGGGRRLLRPARSRDGGPPAPGSLGGGGDHRRPPPGRRGGAGDGGTAAPSRPGELCWRPDRGSRRGPARELAREAGVRVKKVVALHLDIIPGPEDPVVYFFDHDAFLLPLVERGHWLLSFTCQVWDVSPDGPHRITGEDRRQGLAVLSRYRPEWAERCVGGRVFCDAYGPEWVPVVTAAADEPRIVLATAGSGAGYRLGPAIARQALDVISGACS